MVFLQVWSELDSCRRTISSTVMVVILVLGCSFFCTLQRFLLPKDLLHCLMRLLQQLLSQADVSRG